MGVGGVNLRWLLAVTALALCGCGDTVRQQDAADQSEPLVQRAHARAREGDGDGAIALYREALDADPRLARAHLDLGLLYHDYAADYISAVYHYRRYLALRPDSEKSQMIRDRIRLAGQALIASLSKRDSAAAELLQELDSEQGQKLTALEGENRRLARELEHALQELEMVKTRLAELKQRRQAAAEARRNSQPPPPENEPPARQTGRTYEVQRGDSLSKIASKVYGDASEWGRIYKANRASLGGSNRLQVGQVLVIP